MFSGGHGNRGPHRHEERNERCAPVRQGSGMKSAVGSSRTPGTGFFKKSKKRSETRFGQLLMSSGRLVLFSGESEHFFLCRKCGSENKKKILKNSNGWNI